MKNLHQSASANKNLARFIFQHKESPNKSAESNPPSEADKEITSILNESSDNNDESNNNEGKGKPTENNDDAKENLIQQMKDEAVKIMKEDQYEVANIPDIKVSEIDKNTVEVTIRRKLTINEQERLKDQFRSQMQTANDILNGGYEYNIQFQKDQTTEGKNYTITNKSLSKKEQAKLDAESSYY